MHMHFQRSYQQLFYRKYLPLPWNTGCIHVYNVARLVGWQFAWWPISRLGKHISRLFPEEHRERCHRCPWFIVYIYITKNILQRILGCVFLRGNMISRQFTEHFILWWVPLPFGTTVKLKAPIRSDVFRSCNQYHNNPFQYGCFQIGWFMGLTFPKAPLPRTQSEPSLRRATFSFVDAIVLSSLCSPRRSLAIGVT